MLAVGGGSQAGACSDTELIRKVGPLAELLSGAKNISVNETTDETAVSVGDRNFRAAVYDENNRVCWLQDPQWGC